MKARILAVDDEQAFLDGIRRGFAISGFKNACVESDPKKALAILENKGDFDIALIDINIAFVNGIELLKLIKRKVPTQNVSWYQPLARPE